MSVGSCKYVWLLAYLLLCMYCLHVPYSYRLQQELEFLAADKCHKYHTSLSALKFKFHTPPAKPNCTAWVGGTISNYELICRLAFRINFPSHVYCWHGHIYNLIRDAASDVPKLTILHYFSLFKPLTLQISPLKWQGLLLSLLGQLWVNFFLTF